MGELSMIRRLLEHSDWANRQVLDAAAALSDEQLDRGLGIGPDEGSLRRVLTHMWAGEDTWLRRCRGEVEAPWTDEHERLSVNELRARFERTRRAREAFMASIDDSMLGRVQMYRDSRGSLFSATLGDMLLQGVVHSVHHRAQATNAIRRLGGVAPEMDYMVRIRRPV